MPGKVGVKIKAGRNLPVMDRSSDTTDAYVEIKLGSVTHKTDVCRKSLNPQWNTDWFRFEVDDAELQDEPLQIRLMDYDTYSANDAIGKVNISLNPLCIENAGQSNQGKGSVMSGWIPVFDTMHGIRGEVNIIVKVDLFSDFNKFRQSSCGVQFFHSTCVPHGYRAQVIHGFVEELVVNDDPEYQWIDKIRTPRASNEARQVVFLRLSGQVQRKIGLKAINLGANAVIGYTQCFDLEGDVGVVARGIGTAVTLVKIQETINLPVLDSALIEERNLKYLDFLTGGNRNDTTYCSSKFDYDLFGDTDPSGNLVYKILGIDDPFSTKTPNVILKRTWKPKSKAEPIMEEGNSENEGMKQLLKLEDERGGKEKPTPTRRLRHHVKRITHSSRNMLNVKINAIKQKLNDSEKSDNESKSLSSSFSDISESAKNSFSDMRNLMKFGKNRRGTFKRSVSDGSAMASVLVSSILRGPSLESISEGHDSARSTPIKLPKQDNKSESMNNLSSSQNRNSLSPTPLQDSPKHKSESMVNLTQREKNSANKMPLKDVSQISISTISSTSTTEEPFSDDDDEEEEEEEEDAGSETTTPNEIVVVDADTVSMVVKCVLAQESNDLVSDNWIQPNSNDDQGSTSTKVSQTNNDDQKKSINDSETSEINKEIEANANAKELKSILKAVSIDEESGNWIEPGSTTDEPETLVDRRRSSLLHDIRENLTEKFHHLQEHMHLPHFHDDKNKVNKHNMFETAMETILIDKANILGAELEKSEREPEAEPEQTEKIIPKKIEKRRSSFDFVKALHLPFGHGHKKPPEDNNEDTGIFASAMKTILMEPFALSDQISECEVNHKFYDHQSEDVNTNLCETNETDSIKELNLKLYLNQDNETSDGRQAYKMCANREFQGLDVPDLTLTNLNSRNTIKDDQFYSSQPEFCNKSKSIAVSPVEKQFISLTNLCNTNQTPECILTPTSVQSLTISSTNDAKFPNPKVLNFPIVQICPSTPTDDSESPMSPKFFLDSNCNQLTDSYNSDICDQNTQICLENLARRKINKNNENNHTNIKSSHMSLSNCTNKAPMLEPFTPMLLKHHRSSTELVSTSGGSIGGSGSGGDVGVGDERTDSSNGVLGEGQDNNGICNNKLSPAKPILTATAGHIRTESMGFKLSQSPTKGGSNNNSLGLKDSNTAIYRRSSDSDLSVTPKGNSLCVASERLVAATAMMRINPTTNLKSANTDNMDMLEYPFLTMAKYPPGFIMHIGATVAARSVKLLERVPNPDEPETRDSWWTELRMEIRSHARALGCNVVLGYSEVTTISDDVCVLSATGTAAVINMSYTGDSQFDLSTSSKKDLMVSSLDEREVLKELKNPTIEAITTKELSASYTGPVKGSSFPMNSLCQFRVCSLCHIPYTYSSVPFNVKMKKCAICKKGRVPDVLLATIEIPESLHITGRGCFMQAQVMRAKKDLRSESNAKEISDGLPFLEYELHRLLINKLKAKGMNAIFGLKAHVAIGERMIALIATGTAVYLTALPPPTVPKIVAGNSWTDKARLNDLQKSLQETFEKNREIYQLKCLDPDLQSNKQSDTDDSDEEILEMDLNAGNKDTCVLEVDDIEDLEIISLLMEPCPPEGFHVVNTQSVPGLYDLEVVRNLQMFTQVWRAKLSIGQNLGTFPKHFQRLLQTIYFKLRSMIPCAICDLRFRLDLPESDEIQVLVTGMALGLGEPSKLTKLRRKTMCNLNDGGTSSNVNGSTVKKSHDEELIFSLDEDQNMEPTANHITLPNSNNYGTHSLKLRKNSPSRKKFSSVRMPKHLPLHERYGVDITPLSYVPGGKIEKYLGNLNFFFIRESTSIRENGGISGFVHSFITELLAVVRAHISALGGNAMVSFYTTELTLVDNQHKNQGQCLISVGGDVVNVSYFTDD